MKTVFLLGDSLDAELNAQIRDESEKYNDIIQSSFHDTYANLTLKTKLMFEWSSGYCPKAKFFLKIDDDVQFNTENLKEFLAPVLNGSFTLKNTFMCRVTSNSRAIRDPTNVWYLPYEEYAKKILPTFCLGRIIFILS